jgi:hypothetical protein
MNNPSSTISISRHKSIANSLRQYTVSIDDSSVGKIKSGETKQYRVASGSHSVRVKLDFYKSQQLQLDLKPNQTVKLECGENGPETISEVFSLSGFKKNLDAMVKPEQYLFLNLLEEGHGQIRHEQPVPDPARQEQGSQSIFISYRRDDSREITGRICDRLIGKFGRETVFRDVDSIPAGKDFREHINKTIGNCRVVVAIIGTNWLEARNRHGEPRLGLPNDPLSVEIETALEREIPIIPVLVKGAVMPDPSDLPERLKPLAYHNAVIIPREPYFHAGVDRLIDELEKSGNANQGDTGNCNNCGNQIIPGNKFCTRCGSPA